MCCSNRASSRKMCKILVAHLNSWKFHIILENTSYNHCFKILYLILLIIFKRNGMYCMYVGWYTYTFLLQLLFDIQHFFFIASTLPFRCSTLHLSSPHILIPTFLHPLLSLPQGLLSLFVSSFVSPSVSWDLSSLQLDDLSRPSVWSAVRSLSPMISWGPMWKIRLIHVHIVDTFSSHSDSTLLLRYSTQVSRCFWLKKTDMI